MPKTNHLVGTVFPGPSTIPVCLTPTATEFAGHSSQIKRVARPATIVPSAPVVEALAPPNTFDRLPLGFATDKPFDGLDLDTRIMLEQMAIRNQRADAERRAPNRQRYRSQRKYLKVQNEDADQQEAA